MRIRYEFIMWYQQLIKFIPGKLGCFSRNLLLPYKNGDNVLIWDGTHIDSPAKLIIGNNVSINRGCVINAAGKITIASNVLIGPGVVIYSQNHVHNDSDININEQGYITAPVIINKNVWIGSRAIILPGVTIGANSIIGAGSVITQNIADNSIYAGNPAKLIRKRC
ncbi:MAG: acyltransferase [Flavobacteriales bacterium]|jgi:maltose O-acetyltransferase